MRCGPGGPFALDFGAILAMATAMGAMSPLLAELLPEVQPVLMRSLNRDAGDAPDPETPEPSE